MLDPSDLYQLDPDQPSQEQLGAPILIHALTGFVDAGQAGKLAVDHLHSSLDSRVLARFDVDQLHDYRARRPPMVFSGDRWESFESPKLELRLVRDLQDTPFLTLTGPEPDVQWERFVAAVTQLVDHYRVRLVVGLHAIPMAVPHTRPTGLTAHGTRPELVEGRGQWIGRVQVPGSAFGLLELRLGQSGHDAAGFAAHIPHYLAQSEYPNGAIALLAAAGGTGELEFPLADLVRSADDVRAAIDEQVGQQPEVEQVVRALEEQHDAFAGGSGRSLLGPDTTELPTGEELGAEFERFLAAENERRDQGTDQGH